MVYTRAEFSSETPSDEPLCDFHVRAFLKFCVAACFCVFFARVCVCVCVELNQYFVNLCCMYMTGWQSFDRCGLMLVCYVLRLRPFMYAVCEARTTKKLPLRHGDLAVRSSNYCVYCTYSGRGRVDVDTGALEKYGP